MTTTVLAVRDKDAREQTKQLKADAAEAEEMLQLHQEILQAGFHLLEKAKDLGDRLITKKLEVGHGGWSSWCRQYLPQMSQRQASNYIRIADNWETGLKRYLEQADDNLSLRGAIAYLQEAANSDHPGKEEVMRIWMEAIDARFSGRRGKYPILVDVADETFGQQFSFPKSFRTWKQAWEHWQAKGQSYIEGLTRVRESRAQATHSQGIIERATQRPTGNVVPFVAPEAPLNDLQVQTPSTPLEDAATDQESAAPALFLDHLGQELAKGDHVVFYNDAGLAGTVLGVEWNADRYHIMVLWDGDQNWRAYRGRDLKKIPPSEQPQYGEIRDDGPGVEVQYLQAERIEPWVETCSADKLIQNKIRGMFTWASQQWVCTGTASSRAAGIHWLEAVKLMPLDEWHPRETFDYKGICDRRDEMGFSYEGLLITYNRKKWVLTGEKIEFRPEEENGNSVSNLEAEHPEPVFEYDDYVTGPDKTGVIRTGWVIEAGYTTMYVTDDEGKAAYDMGATRHQLENCWGMDQATAEHCEPESSQSLEDDGEPAIEVEVAVRAHSDHFDADDMPIEIGDIVTPKHKPFSRYGKVTGFRSDKKTPIIVQWQTGADGYWGAQALLVVQGEDFEAIDNGGSDHPIEDPDTEMTLPPMGTRGTLGGRPGIWVVAQHTGTSGLTLWSSAGKTMISANEFTPFDEEPDTDYLASHANVWLNHMTEVLGTVEVIRMALAFASPQELKNLSEDLTPDEFNQVRDTIEAAISVGGQILGTGAVYSMAKKQLRQAQGEA